MNALLALPAIASPERIGVIDYDDWSENTDFGLPPDHERVAWDDLVYEEPLGPYVRAIWLGNQPGWRLPIVRGRFWSDERSYWPGVQPHTRVHVQTWEQQWTFLVDALPIPDDERYLGAGTAGFDRTREAFRRVLRVLVRREHGYHTSYRSQSADPARSAGVATAGSAA